MTIGENGCDTRKKKGGQGNSVLFEIIHRVISASKRNERTVEYIALRGCCQGWRLDFETVYFVFYMGCYLIEYNIC